VRVLTDGHCIEGCGGDEDYGGILRERDGSTSKPLGHSVECTTKPVHPPRGMDSCVPCVSASCVLHFYVSLMCFAFYIFGNLSFRSNL